MGKSTPKAPDPAQTIAAQSAANKEAITESARVNAVDQYGPQGSTTYQKGADGVPTSQTVKLNDQGQRIYDNQQNIAEGLTTKAGELAARIPTGPMDISALNARQTSLAPSGQAQGYSPQGLPAAQTSIGQGLPAATTSIGQGLPAMQTSVPVPALQSSVASRAGEIGNLGNGSNLPSLPGVNDFGAQAKITQDATFGKAQALLQPGQQLDQRRLQQSLADRGIPLDSPAGQAELTRMAQSQSEANNRAAYDAVGAGSSEQSRLFGLASSARGQLFGEDTTRTQVNNQAADQRFNQDLQSGTFSNSAAGQLFGMNTSNANLNNAAQQQMFGQQQANASLNNSTRQQLFGEQATNASLNNATRDQLFNEGLATTGANNAAQQQNFNQHAQSASFNNTERNNALSEQLMLRNQDFNEASALLQGAPVMQQPGFQQNAQYNMQPVDAAGITQTAYQNQVAAAQANNPWQGLFGIGAAALKASDGRLKRNVIPIGTGWRGLPLYLFRYVWSGAHEIGVMAQDVARVMPEAVVRTASGYLAVDYGMLREAA